MKLNEAYVFDESGYLCVAFLDEADKDIDDLLSLFRRAYINKEEKSLKNSDLESGYSLLESEMEACSVSKTINKSEFDDAIRIWAKELPQWALDMYQEKDYISHIAFRDKLHEGIYESLTKLKTGYLYWYHG